MSLNPFQRPNMEEIRAHPWMQGEVPCKQEVRREFRLRKAYIDEAMKIEQEQLSQMSQE